MKEYINCVYMYFSYFYYLQIKFSSNFRSLSLIVYLRVKIVIFEKLNLGKTSYLLLPQCSSQLFTVHLKE